MENKNKRKVDLNCFRSMELLYARVEQAFERSFCAANQWFVTYVIAMFTHQKLIDFKINIKLAIILIKMKLFLSAVVRT